MIQKDAIVAAIKMTNINLLNMDIRCQQRSIKKEAQAIIMQSEALAMFKGNIIKTLKVTSSSTTVNRIKSSLILSLSLNENSLIDRVGIDWRYKEYIPKDIQTYETELTEAFMSIKAEDLQQAGTDAIYENKVFKRADISVSLPSPVVKTKEISSIKDVNFDSITNIKFKVK